MNTKALRIVYVVFGVQLLALLVLFSTGCGPVHSSQEQAMETVATITKMGYNRFEVKSSEIVDGDKIKVNLVSRNIALVCVVSRKVSDDELFSSPAPQSYLGQLVEQQGTKAFSLGVNSKPYKGIKCVSSTGDFSEESLTYVNFIPDYNGPPPAEAPALSTSS